MPNSEYSDYFLEHLLDVAVSLSNRKSAPKPAPNDANARQPAPANASPAARPSRASIPLTSDVSMGNMETPNPRGSSVEGGDSVMNETSANEIPIKDAWANRRPTFPPPASTGIAPRRVVAAPVSLTYSFANSGQQNQQQQNNPPAGASSSILGGSTANQPSANTSSLFGGSNANNTTTTTGGSLFSGGGTGNLASTNTGGSSLFGGGGTNNQQNTSGTGSGSLFSRITAGPPAQQASAGGLFGGGGATNNQQPTSGAGTSSLFSRITGGPQPQQGSVLGGAAAGQQQQQQPTQPSLFGAGTASNGLGGGNTAGSNLFGGATNNASSSLFGGGTNTASGGVLGGNTSSVFGTSIGSQQPAGTSLFAKPAIQTSNNSGSSLFGGNPQPQQQQAPSLLSSVHQSKLNQGPPFGTLSMGQGTTAPTTVGAVKVDLSSLRSTTRFEDCVDQVREGLEHIDKLIQQQERYAKEIEAFVPKHSQDVLGLQPDVDFIKDKVDGVEQALIMDAQGVEAQRITSNKDRKDMERCERIVANLQLPSAYHHANMSLSTYGGMYGSQQHSQRQPGAPDAQLDQTYDTDLVGNYFVPMAAELHRTMQGYINNMAEIESHMGVIESSAVAQAQQLAARKAGVDGGSGQMSSEDTVRELADTLRGFEESILGVAGAVGECREGVNELVLGRLGGNLKSYV